MNSAQWTPESCLADVDTLAKHLKCSEFIRSLPFLNHSKLEKMNDMTLVRFRGMIQDMCDPEIYLEAYEVQSKDGSSRLQNGKFRDTILVKDDETFFPDSAQNKHGERRTMFVITVPGLNKWAEEAEKSFAADQSSDQSAASTKGVKRHIEDDHAMETDQPDDKNHAPKKLHSANGSQPDCKLMLSPEYLVNSPIADRPSKACMVKIYEHFDTFKLNNVVDIVGFLSVDPALDGTMHDPDEFVDPTEQQSKNPPPSLIPRLHAIQITPVSHLNPLLELNNPCVVESAEELRKDLEMALTACLFGDKLAANIILCHLVSSVYVRNEMNCLGQFSVNLSHVPVAVHPDYTKQLYEVIEMLMPASHYLPMTLDNMNTLQFAPKKDYQTNKLTSGLLQLAPHTHLVLDETKLQPGKLEGGVNAIANIAHMIKNQKLKYNFQFYQLEFDTDIPILVVSEGKSMMPHDCHVPLMPDSETIELINETVAATKHFLHSKLQQIRTFLTKARLQTFEMSTEDPEMIQNDIIEIRRETNATVEELHQLMVMGRLVGLTFGKTRMDREAWNVAKEMHKEIRIRHESVNKNRNEQ